MSGRRRSGGVGRSGVGPGGEGPAPAAAPPSAGGAPERRPELPHSGLAAEVLPRLHGEAAPAPAPPAVPAPAEAPDLLASPERVYAFADRLQGAGREAEEKPEELETWVSFLLDGDTFALPVTHVHEIIRVTSITRVPHAPFPVRGITNLRGQVLPVVDLRLRLGLPGAALGEESRILVATSRGRTVGLLVDRVAQVVRIAPSKVQPPPPDVMSDRSEYIRGVCDVGSELAILLDIGPVLLIPPSLEPPPKRGPARRRRKA